MHSGTSAVRQAPRLVRSLLWRICAVFLACLLVLGCAIQFFIVAPATQALGQLQLELATTRIQSGAEQHFRDIETRLHSARNLAGRLKLDDADGFRALFAPFIDGDTPIAAIHLADADGRQLTLRHGSDQALQGRTSADHGHPDPASRPWLGAAQQAGGGDEIIGWTPPYRLPATGDGGLSVFTRWTGADGKSRILAFEIPLATLSQLSRNNPVGQAGSGILLTDGGQIVGLPRPEGLDAALLEPLAQINAGFLGHGYARWLETGRKSGETLLFNNAGETWLTRFVPLQLGQQRWWVGGFARTDDFTQVRLQDMAWALAILAALAATAAVGLTRRIEADLIRKQTELEEQLNRRTDQLAEKSRALADQLLFVHQLLDVLPNPVFYKGPDACFLGCNRAYEEAFGTQREDLIGKTVLELPHLPPAIRSAYQDSDQKILAGGGKLHQEVRVTFADGKEHDALFWINSFRVASGEPGGLLGVLVDITPQKQAEREARAAEEWIHRILESSPIAVVINRPGGPPLFVNSRAPELAGTDMTTFMQQPATNWFSKREVAESIVAQVASGCPVRDQEIEFRPADGSSLWTLVTLEPIEFLGSPALIGWIYDITRRKVAEQELRKLSLAVEQSPSMLVITLPDGTIQYANPRFCQETGLNAAELAGTRPDLLDAAGEPFEFHIGQWLADNEASVWRRECQLRRRHGDPLWVGISVSGLAENQGGDSGEITHCIWVLEDLSMHRQALQTLRDTKRLAEEATESKTRFMANMSHEIRTPLNAIIGLADLCLATGLEARQHDYIAKIKTAGATLLSVVNDILDFSKIEAGKFELEKTPFTLDRVLGNVITFVAQKAHEKGLELLIDIGLDVPQNLIGDPLRLGQVLTNLLGNAVKFTPRGDIRLKISVADSGPRRVTLRFEVSDTGIGLSSGQIEGLFEAFSQADSSMTRRFGGTGLGLSITRHLVGLMGGSPIRVDSSPGSGSRFGFSAPFELATTATPRVFPDALKGLRVLVVDDHPAAREALLGLLGGFPFRSEAVGSATEAFDAVRQADGTAPFRLVLMDLRTPDGEDIEATRKLKEASGLANPPALILLTAYGNEHTAGQAGYLHKPATASTLLDAIIGACGPATSPQPAPPNATRPLQGLRILVVEDNDINRQIACSLLEKRGAIVRMAENGRLGVEALQRAGPEAFDAVLMDLQMPEMDGLEATLQIRRDPRFAALPIIAMTAHALPEQRRQCIEAGMNDHVAKPIVPEVLFAAILSHTRPKPADSPADALPRLPGLDVVSALRRLNNKPDTYLSLLRRFVTSQADCAGHIDTALAAGQFKDAERLAHTLRGTAANLGADALRDAACALETTLRQGATPAAAQPLATRLGAELAALITMLEGALPPAPPAAYEGPAVLGQTEFDAAVATLIQLMQSADGAAPALFLQLRPDLAARIGTGKTARIAESLQRYDYDHALDCLHAALDPGHPAHTGDNA